MNSEKKKRKHKRYRDFIARSLHEGRFGLYRPKVYLDKKRALKRDKHNEHQEEMYETDE